MSKAKETSKKVRSVDFTGAVRGKFYRPGATIRLPIYLDPKTQAYLEARAAEKGVTLNDLVNALLTKDIELYETFR